MTTKPSWKARAQQALRAVDETTLRTAPVERGRIVVRQADVDAAGRAMLDAAAKLPDLVPAKKHGGKRPKHVDLPAVNGLYFSYIEGDAVSERKARAGWAAAQAAASKPQHGGKRPGAGRKPLAEGEDSTIINARVTKTQAEKFKRIGGAAWLRPAIDKAREPKG